jgi:hypothetical protein
LRPGSVLKSLPALSVQAGSFLYLLYGGILFFSLIALSLYCMHNR